MRAGSTYLNSLSYAKLIGAQKGPLISTLAIKALWNLWFAGGNFAFLASFISTHHFWPSVWAYFKSFYFLYQFTKGGAP
jgi:hypothetical protein